jgi:L-fuconolactonase
MTVDAHQHFWRYSGEEYSWIDASMEAIRRDFLPADLAPQLSTLGIEGSVAVQARQSVDETEWLLDLAEQHAFIKGVVGWVPLTEQGAGIGALLERFVARRRFVGVRHVLQAETDSYFSQPSFDAALSEVSGRELSYDLLVYAHQLEPSLSLVDRHPSLRVIVDHIAKPVVQGSPPEAWRRQLRELARRPNVFCKFSGVATEAPGWQWTPEALRPYFEEVLEAFGPGRLMFGSDWPVCLVATSYERWTGFVRSCVAPLSLSEREAILGGTAASAYRLEP